MTAGVSEHPLIAAAQPLDYDLVAASDAPFLVDTVYRGEMLCVTFGYVDWARRPDFDFFGRLKKLETTSGAPINKLLLRDPGNAWYQRGLPGVGADIDAVAARLGELIETVAPKQTVFIGQSMGAYGAIMFGALLDVTTILAFGPLSFFDPVSAVTYHDRRWLQVMLDLDQDPPPIMHRDLPALCRARGEGPDLRVFFGTKPDVGASESTGLDVLHAMRFAALANCRVQPFPASGHAVVNYLIETGQIDALLARHILGIDTDEPAPPDDWVSWIGENVRRGADLDELTATMIQAGNDERLTRSALDRVIHAEARTRELRPSGDELKSPNGLAGRSDFQPR